MKTRLLGIAVVLHFVVGCGQQAETTDPEPGFGEVKQKNESGSEPGESPDDALAEGSEIPDGLGSLDLTKGQAATINEWLGRQGDRVDPADFAKLVMSVLREDQQDAFREIVESGGG